MKAKLFLDINLANLENKNLDIYLTRVQLDIDSKNVEKVYVLTPESGFIASPDYYQNKYGKMLEEVLKLEVEFLDFNKIIKEILLFKKAITSGDEEVVIEKYYPFDAMRNIFRNYVEYLESLKVYKEATTNKRDGFSYTFYSENVESVTEIYSGKYIIEFALL